MPIQAVTRALTILRLFSLDQPILGITEISRRTGLHKATRVWSRPWWPKTSGNRNPLTP